MLSDISSTFSAFLALFHLVVDAPILGVGIVVGGLVYRFYLSKNPTAVANIVSKLEAAAAAEIAQLAAAKTGSTVVPAANVTAAK